MPSSRRCQHPTTILNSLKSGSRGMVAPGYNPPSVLRRHLAKRLYTPLARQLIEECPCSTGDGRFIGIPLLIRGLQPLHYHQRGPVRFCARAVGSPHPPYGGLLPWGGWCFLRFLTEPVSRQPSATIPREPSTLLLCAVSIINIMTLYKRLCLKSLLQEMTR